MLVQWCAHGDFLQISISVHLPFLISCPSKHSQLKLPTVFLQSCSHFLQDFRKILFKILCKISKSLTDFGLSDTRPHQHTFARYQPACSPRCRNTCRIQQYFHTCAHKLISIDTRQYLCYRFHLPPWSTRGSSDSRSLC